MTLLKNYHLNWHLFHIPNDQNGLMFNLWNKMTALTQLSGSHILTDVSNPLDFSYLLANLGNEQNLGFVIDGSSTCVRNIINKDQDDKNYFIRTSK